MTPFLVNVIVVSRKFSTFPGVLTSYLMFSFEMDWMSLLISGILFNSEIKNKSSINLRKEISQDGLLLIRFLVTSNM